MSTPSRVLFAGLALFLSPLLLGFENEPLILRALDSLRGIEATADSRKIAELNARMDAAWRVIEAHPAEAQPLVQRELERELSRKDPDQFFVLDVSKLALSLDARADALALRGLTAIDPSADIVQYNFQELFELTFALAKTGRPEVVAQIDRIFLSGKHTRELIIAQHALVLPAKLVPVFLYGVAGPDIEDHLVHLLETRPNDRTQLFEILAHLGSPKCVSAVQRSLESCRDANSAATGLGVLPLVGGPKGKEAILHLDTSHFDHAAKDLYQMIRPQAEKLSFEMLTAALKRYDGAITRLSDDELKLRLQKIYDNYGVEHELSPCVVVTSKLPKEELLAQLFRIRPRMFYRVNQHALEDVLVTNLMINALQFREY